MINPDYEGLAVALGANITQKTVTYATFTNGAQLALDTLETMTPANAVQTMMKTCGLMPDNVVSVFR